MYDEYYNEYSGAQSGVAQNELTNTDAERSLIGSVLIRPSILVDISDEIIPEMFSDKRNELVVKTMLDMFSQSSSIDTITLTNTLKSDGKLVEVGGATYITELSTAVPSSYNFETYLSIIKDKYMRRKLVSKLTDVTRDAYDNSKDIQEVTSGLISEVSETISTGSGVITLAEALKEFETNVTEFIESGKEFVGEASGFNGLDRKLGGIRAGHLGILSAYSSTGKTAFALNIFAKYIKDGKKVVMFSLEMSAAQIIARLLGTIAEIDIHKLERGQLSEQETIRLNKAKELIKNSNSVIYHNSNWTYIKMMMFKESVKGNTDLYLIDYLQLIRNGGKDLFQTMMQVSQELQFLLLKFKKPMIALSQISNESNKATNDEHKTPKGAGDITASADWVGLLKTDEESKEIKDMKQDKKLPIKVKLVLQKNRHGQTGIQNFYFLTSNGIFAEQDSFDLIPYQAALREVEAMGGSDDLDNF